MNNLKNILLNRLTKMKFVKIKNKNFYKPTILFNKINFIIIIL